MSNPWLNIPLDDYEGHMSLPAVGQAQMLAEQLDRALARWAPKSIAVIGCAGGNGLDKIAGKTLERVVAVDVNPDYIERTRVRYARRLPNAILTSVLQLPHRTIQAVSPSPYNSLGRLASAMTLVAPEALHHAALAQGFAATDSTIIELSSGKRFCVQNFTVES